MIQNDGNFEIIIQLILDLSEKIRLWKFQYFRENRSEVGGTLIALCTFTKNRFCYMITVRPPCTDSDKHCDQLKEMYEQEL